MDLVDYSYTYCKSMYSYFAFQRPFSVVIATFSLLGRSLLGVEAFKHVLHMDSRYDCDVAHTEKGDRPSCTDVG